MSEKKKPWYMKTLVRMDQKARCICSAQLLGELGKRLKSAELSEGEQAAIVAEIDRMLQNHAGNYEQSAIFYLKSLQKSVQRWPWYVTLLEEMGTYAQNSGFMQALMEAGEDLSTSELGDEDREAIIIELDRMLRDNTDSYRRKAAQYLEELRHQIAGAP